MYTRNPALALYDPCNAGRHLASSCAPAEGVSIWVWGAQGSGHWKPWCCCRTQETATKNAQLHAEGAT